MTDLLALQLLTAGRTLLMYLLPMAAFLFGIYSFFRRENADALAKRTAGTAAEEARLKGIETLLAHHEQRFTGMVVEASRYADEVTGRFIAHERQLNEIPTIRENMVEMRSQMKYMVEGIGKLEAKLDRIIERLTRQP